MFFVLIGSSDRKFEAPAWDATQGGIPLAQQPEGQGLLQRHHRPRLQVWRPESHAGMQVFQDPHKICQNIASL